MVCMMIPTRMLYQRPLEYDIHLLVVMTLNLSMIACAEKDHPCNQLSLLEELAGSRDVMVHMINTIPDLRSCKLSGEPFDHDLN